MPDLTEFEERIGYHFERREILTRALTHKSYSHEAKQEAIRDNETFEFLGDSVLGFVIGVRALSLFALVWTVLAWLGLSWIYVISHFEYSSYLDSTKERVVASLVVGAAALIPLFAAECWNRLSVRDRDRLPSAGG